MRAVRVVRHGRPTEAIEVRDDVPVPDVEDGHVRIAVSAASLNYGDIARCRGGVASVMAQPPFTLGMDVCGVVEAADAGAERWLGERVVGITPMALGGLAETALVPLHSVFAAPPELGVAAGFNDDPLSGMTGRPLRRVSMGNFSVVGVLLSYSDGAADLRRFGLSPFGPDDGARAHDELLALVAAGRIRPLVGRRIGLDE